MAKRLLIDGVHAEETRVAIVEDSRLVDLDIEWSDQIQLKGNIYKAPITRIEPSLQAAFLDIGASRNGFLQINDIHPAYFKNWPNESSGGRRSRPAIQDVLDAGQELVVQVVKDEREAKGATLTTNLSIPGRYLVLMVGNQRGGVSRKISDASQRKRLRQVVHSLQVPAGMGVIVRTAGINKTAAELQRDLDTLLDGWNDIVSQSLTGPQRILLYRESDLATRAIRDYLTADIDEIIIDGEEIHTRALAFIERVMPNFIGKLSLHTDPQPLFSKFLVDQQVAAINQPEVSLPSGGSIVINVTEAVVAVDVNSGRATSQADVEETAFQTNKEAAEEIARQLRLRDLGGLVVIDFIDMGDRRHKQTVERFMREAVRKDKAKVEINRISKFGLLEMSRQRMKSSLESQSHVICPQCEGRGHVKASYVVALEALRKIQSSVYAGGIVSLRVRMAPASALYLLNDKRQVLAELERKCGVQILIIADGRVRSENYEIELVTNRRNESVQGAAGEQAGSSSRAGGRKSDRGGPGNSGARGARGGRQRGGRRDRRRGGRRDDNRDSGPNAAKDKHDHSEANASSPIKGNHSARESNKSAPESKARKAEETGSAGASFERVETARSGS